MSSRARNLISSRFVIRATALLVVVLLVRSYVLCSPYVCPKWNAPAASPDLPLGEGDDFDLLQEAGQGAGAMIAAPSKALVVASLKSEDTAWLNERFEDWHKAIYVVDDPAANLTVEQNKGRESSAYLTYIIDNYHNLPETMVFLHAERYQWHNEDPMYDGVPPIENLRLNHVQEEGYANLRCTWSLGCPAALHPHSPISKLEAALEPNNDRANTEAAYTKAFRELFPAAAEVPSAVGVPCGAQFALARHAVLARPLREWLRVRRWLWSTPLPDSVSGRIMEYAWHILGGKPPQHCPDTKQCFCDRFGLCDLDCPQAGSCEGRYRRPKHEQIPAGWPAVGPGTNGFPPDKWWEG